MRRRERGEVIEPPGHLVAFHRNDWVPLVDPAGYDPDRHRNRGPDGPYGPSWMSYDNWLEGEAQSLWTSARLQWCREHGWPGGLDVLDLLRQAVNVRRGGPNG
jgi:hypothetical protein